MVSEIAEVDLNYVSLQIYGNQQSVLNLQIADLVRDRDTLALARNYALKLLKKTQV
jgi:ATP-dependent DNA helicase RecG